MKICAIIPTSGSQEILKNLRKSINSLCAASKYASIDLIIYIVTDSAELRCTILDLRVDNFIVVSTNLGFSGRNNVALEELFNFHTPDYVLFINDDAWVDIDFFAKFIVLPRRGSDLVNPVVFEKDSKNIDSFGSEYFLSGYAKNAYNLFIPTQLATAACLLVKTSILKRMYRRFGFYFNELLHYYLEDVEFSIRARSIGAAVSKSSTLLAHHVGSMTSRKKSYFVMYHTYRNILWLIIMTWPKKIIIKNIKNILLVQSWVFLYSLHFSPLLYITVIFDTFKKTNTLLKYRRHILKKYDKDFNFEILFSKYSFRTHHGLTI